MTSRPRIAVTMGDPAGVGPEVCLHLLASEEIARQCIPIVFGDLDILRRVAEQTNLPLNAAVIRPGEWSENWSKVQQPSILDLKVLAADAVEPGHVNAATGRAGFTYVDRAIDAALAGQV